MRRDTDVARGTPGARPPRARPALARNTVGLPATQIELDDVQGLLATKLENLPEAAFLLLRVGPRAAAARWLDWVADQTWFAADIPTTVAVNVAFTYAGLVKLGLEPRALAEFPEPFRSDPQGAGRRAHRLGDEGQSAPFSWAWGNVDNTVDVLVMLYAAEPKTLADLLDAHQKQATCAGLEVVEGTPLRAATFQDPFKEPFGFADGISQPSIDRVHTNADSERPIATGEFLLGYPNEIGVYPPSPSVTPDDATAAAELDSAFDDSRRDLGRNGTYLVFRQLEQDVLAFWKVADAQTRAKASAPGSLEKWGAKMIGRWPSGAPLVLCPEADDPGLHLRNDFTYRKLDDDRGLLCPAGAHIRRTNPRDALPRTDGYRSLAVVRQHRIVRRGRAYGEPLKGWPNPQDMVREDDRSKGRGLCFLCFNADLRQQFEFIQERWMNDPTFVSAKSGERDPLIGDPGSDATFTVPADPVPVCLGNNETPLSRFVTVRGSAYFFVPSRRALTYLGLVASRS